MSLKDRVKNGIKWSFIQTVVLQLVNFLTLIFLARTIPPYYHGLITIASLSGTFVGVIGTLGIQEKIIVDNEIGETAFKTYFWFSLLSGLILSLVSLLITVILSWFYSNNYDVYDVLLTGGILSVTPLFGLLNGFFESNYAKKLNFKKISKVNILATVITATTTITITMLGYYKSALVVRLLLGHAVLTVVYFILLKRTIPYYVDWKLIASMKSFSSFLTLNSIANYIVRNVDYILIGKFFPPEILGQYTIAYKILLFPLKVISGKIYSVMLPVLSANLSNPTLFKKLYFAMTGIISFVVFPVTALIGLNAWYWVPIVFPPEYTYIEEMITILSVIGTFQSLISPVGGLFLLKSNTKKMFVNSIIVAFFVSLAFGISCLYGDISLVLKSFAITWIGLVFPITLISAFNLFNFKLTDFFKSTQYSLFGCLAAFTVFYLFRKLNLELIDFWLFVLSSALFILVYICFYYLISKNNPNYRLQRYISLIKN